MGLVQNNGSQDYVTKIVWYAGTATLKEGFALSYDNDDTNAPIVPTAGDLSAQSRRNLRGRRVVDPATANLGGFAGLVAGSSDGVVGPAFVEIVVPRTGDIAVAWTNVNCTKNSTFLGITNAGGNTCVVVTPALTGTAFQDYIGQAFQTVDRSGTAGQVLIRFK